MLTVAIACGVLAVVYPRLAVFWQVVGVFVAALGTVATVVTACEATGSSGRGVGCLAGNFAGEAPNLSRLKAD
ncbi:hypothetical protein [Streptomyces noursei]|uniref:hypothetical protein n=1 Tax=Streptomyces noursei TaxID=1971 RepID=UPI001678AAA4|nr:hypothetical protein [Streptomyces noursei]MCZ1021085.1 hypothetical protein [Streptomyces noursei]GGX55475.1 hypothetical protein GCM10010341_90340 [Streptomyces noursei]